MEIKISEKIKKTQIDSDKEIAEILTNVLKAEQKTDKDKEHFWGVYFNARNNIKRIELVSLGSTNANLVHPRETLRPAIESSATALIVAHNHPSGEVEPSQDDIEITKRLVEARKIIGIDLYDHLIINEKGEFYSFKDKNLI